jgi:hypothetical protein
MAERYSPNWAPHVVGAFERKADEDGNPEPIWIELTCSRCGEQGRTKCVTGAPRQQILRWATIHAHRDPFARPKKEGGA